MLGWALIHSQVVHKGFVGIVSVGSDREMCLGKV